MISFTVPKWVSSLVIAIMMTLVATTPAVATNIIVNGDFEACAPNSGSSGSTSVVTVCGWTFADSARVI